MAKAETDVVHRIMLRLSPKGVRLFKNVRGLFYTKDSVMQLLAAIKSRNLEYIVAAVKRLRQVMAGLLAEGASDLIGFTPVVITPEMVGRTIAVFTAIEAKGPESRPSREQLDFAEFVRNSGGFAGVAYNPEEAEKIVQIGG